MRFIQTPLWLAIGIGLAVYLGSIDKDLATALIFACTFGLIYGGSMSLLKPPSMLGKKGARNYQGGFGRKPYVQRSAFISTKPETTRGR